uniref:Uncharacterized protein LOC102809517 n=1 Tax=Saccoglossus kowalevskii TaxID=10224 RepID=A0ABM0M877_SACKO|nr:PREDICTED: uncharacterized protein LOC102809517 [Saccoglossus kowalevskii]
MGSRLTATVNYDWSISSDAVQELDALRSTFQWISWDGKKALKIIERGMCEVTGFEMILSVSQFLLFVFLFCFIGTGYCQRCPSGWYTHMQKCFKVISDEDPRNAYQARARCAELGGTLVVIETAEMNDYVASILEEEASLYWIGLHDIGEEENFLWVDNTPLKDYESCWDTNEPSNSQDSEDCVQIRLSSGKWNDDSCYDNADGIVCQTAMNEPNGWDSVNGKCLKYYANTKTWDAARSFCVDVNADLIVVQNSITQEYVYEKSRNGDVWIGLTDKLGANGEYKWIDNRDLGNFNNWSPGQPDSRNSAGNCVEVRFDTNGEWFTQDCSVSTNAFICQKNEDVVNDGDFAWADGTTSVSFRNWDIGQPVDTVGQPDCGYVYIGHYDGPKTWRSDGRCGPNYPLEDGTPAECNPDSGFPCCSTYGWCGSTFDHCECQDCVDYTEVYHMGEWDTQNCFLLQQFICEIPTGIGSCDAGWTLHGDYCYLFDTTIKTVHGAQDSCGSHNAMLASIEDEDEQSFINGRVFNIGIRFWIGLHDIDDENQFEWFDGTPFVFTNWGPGEPNNAGEEGEDCVHLIDQEDKLGEWNDQVCTDLMGYICKKRKSIYNPSCGRGYEYYPALSTCYKFVTDEYLSWDDAETQCHVGGGHLLSISGFQEQTHITARMYGLNAPVLWIGANDRTVEGGWSWSDGTAFAYLNWHVGEPNDANVGEDCTEIIVTSGLWNDHHCYDNNIGYICKNKGVIVDHFYVYHDNALDSALSSLHIENVYPEECAKRCLEEKQFTCMSFNYDKVNIACELSSENQNTGGGLITYLNHPIDYYEVVSRPDTGQLTTLAPHSRCQAGWWSYRSYCYYLQTVRMPWIDALESCRKFGGDLVSIADESENNFVTTFIHSMCEEWHFDSTSTSYDYQFIEASPGVTRTDFEVKANNDVHIALSEEERVIDPMYEIVLGASGNTRSVIRRGSLSNEKKSVQTPGIVSMNEWRSFWISWSNGEIKVGREGEAPFIQWKDPDPLPVNFVGYSTGWGSEGEFRLCVEHTNRESDDKVWTGLTDLRQQMSFQWSDMSDVTYTKWANGEPNNYDGGNEDCGNIFTHNDKRGYWNDGDCSKYFMSVCKKPKEVLPPTTVGLTNCDAGWIGSGYSCYRFESTPTKTWSNAQTQCQAWGGNLATVNDNLEQAFLASILSTLIRNERYWIGLNDLSSVGEYDWVDGEKVTYTNWGDNQPDTRTGDCVAMAVDNVPGLWYGHQCSESKYYICEKWLPGYTPPPPYTGPPTNPSDIGCSTGWVGFEDNCFLPVYRTGSYNRKTWSAARASCVTMGADLASFHSAEEENYVILNSQIENTWDGFWIGLNDRMDETGFEWSDGSPLEHINWNEGEPNDVNNEDCVEMFFSTERGWNDLHCDQKKSWVCKIRKGVSPSTTSSPAIATTEPSAGNCDNEEWIRHRTACYFFSKTSSVADKSWEDARQYCRQQAAELISIHSVSTQTFVHNQIAGKYNVWIGLREYVASSTYSWSDSSPLDYINWAHGEPNDSDGQEKCVECREYDSSWNDMNCGDRMPFVCKKSIGAITPPSIVSTPAPSGYCPEGFLEHTEKCYQFNGGDESYVVDWYTARDRCRSAGGDLATIHSQALQAYLTSNLRDIEYSMWIGLSDTIQEGKYRWTDGSSVDYYNWRAGEPNGENQENCVEMHFQGYGGLWNDGSCDSTAGYICQGKKDYSNPVPVPTINPCKPGYVSYYKGCYKVIQSQYTYDVARNLCLNDDADLISIEDIYEHSYVEMYSLLYNQPLWIGLNDQSTEGVYRWTDGTPVVYTRWGDGEPSKDSGEGCVRMELSGSWNDTLCSSTGIAMCKYWTGTQPTTPKPSHGSCPTGSTWIEYANHCYSFAGVQERKSWPEASYECQRIDGYLVTIHSEAENQYIQSRINENNNNIWIGLTRTQLGGFEWVDKSPLAYDHWGDGEPNFINSEENCGEMRSNSGNWNDVDCYLSYGLGFVCKRHKDADGPTQPPHPGYTTIPGSVENPQKLESTGDLSSGAIIGIILVVLLVVVGVVAITFLFYSGRFPLKSSMPGLSHSKKNEEMATGFENVTYSETIPDKTNDNVKLSMEDTILAAADEMDIMQWLRSIGPGQLDEILGPAPENEVPDGVNGFIKARQKQSTGHW